MLVPMIWQLLDSHKSTSNPPIYSFSRYIVEYAYLLAVFLEA